MIRDLHARRSVVMVAWQDDVIAILPGLTLSLGITTNVPFPTQPRSRLAHHRFGSHMKMVTRLSAWHGERTWLGILNTAS